MLAVCSKNITADYLILQTSVCSKKKMKYGLEKSSGHTGAIIRSNFVDVFGFYVSKWFFFSFFGAHVFFFSRWHCTYHVGVLFLYCDLYFTKQFLKTLLRHSVIIEELFLDTMLVFYAVNKNYPLLTLQRL